MTLLPGWEYMPATLDCQNILTSRCLVLSRITWHSVSRFVLGETGMKLQDAFNCLMLEGNIGLIPVMVRDILLKSAYELRRKKGNRLSFQAEDYVGTVETEWNTVVHGGLSGIKFIAQVEGADGTEFSVEYYVTPAFLKARKPREGTWVNIVPTDVLLVVSDEEEVEPRVLH